MANRRLAPALGLGLIALAATAEAQDPVRDLQDLIGARGSSGESALESRGYTWVGGEKSGTASFTYWQKGDASHCISVKTEDGRYQAIVHAMPFDCQKGNPAPVADTGAQADKATPDPFETVCGAIVDGKTYRYRCKAVDFRRDGRTVRTALHYPDQKIVLVWKSATSAKVHFEGMNPQEARVSTSEGETDFFFEDRTYFYISNRDAARLEVQNFRE